MKFKCDKCDKPATAHLTEISDTGQKIVKHLCNDCLGPEGIQIKPNVPIDQLLEEFLLSGTPGQPSLPDLTCDVCGATFADYHNEERLGCPNDYDAFGQPMQTIIAQMQEGATEHIGKVPHRAGGDQQKQTAVLRLRGELKRAIAVEDYERAAALRDQIHQLEEL